MLEASTQDFARPVAFEDLIAHLPAEWPIDPARLAGQVAAGRRLVVLDDDPTGTQSIADLPVLTSWSIPDIRWALAQPTSGFFVLTNTRSLAERDAAERNRQIVRALTEAARLDGVDVVIASRSDSTLRGHYPLETDVLAAELARAGIDIDGVVIVPAYLEPGRITIDSMHWMRTNDGMIPVAQSEFARDASFGYDQSDLRDWVEEKTSGRITAADVGAVTVVDLRQGGPDEVGRILNSVSGGRPVVVDAVTDDDLRVLVTALLQVEARGKNFLYRTGPSFVRARSGQQATAPIDRARLALMLAGPDPAQGDPADERQQPGSTSPRRRSDHGLIVVGSHVGLTTRQLDRLRLRGRIVELELDVPTLLDAQRYDPHLRDTVVAAVRLLSDRSAESDVVIRTSRTLVAGADAVDSLVIARTVSAALVTVVQEIVGAIRPSFVIGKGGITSSDTATGGLGIRRAWARGTLLPGIVSLWEPVSGPAAGIPYVVFAGNVGDDDALAAVVDILRGA